MSEKKSTTVTIELLGQKMTLKTGDKGELVHEAVEVARTKLRDAQLRLKTGAAHQVALIALLDMAEDYIRAKKRVLEQKKLISDRTDRLIDLVDSELRA